MASRVACFEAVGAEEPASPADREIPHSVPAAKKSATTNLHIQVGQSPPGRVVKVEGGQYRLGDAGRDPLYPDLLGSSR